MIKDLLSKEVKIGDSVVCQDYDGLSVGTVRRFTSGTVVIQIHFPYDGRRQIRHDLIHKKIMVTNGCS